MTTARSPHATPGETGSSQPSRARFRDPASSAGFIDAAWWPRSRDLPAELPALLDVVWGAGRDINRITYNLSAWDPAPRRLVIDGRTVRLGGFTVGEPHTATLTDAWAHERVDILVIAPDTDPEVAKRALDLASAADSTYRAGELLARAAGTAATGAAAQS